MIKSNEDIKITPLPAAEPTAPQLTLQNAAQFLAGVQRLNELAAVPNYQPEHDKEATEIRAELGLFVSTHAVQLVHGWLNAAAILHPLQQSLSNIIVPAVAKALHDYHTNSKGEASPADAK